MSANPDQRPITGHEWNTHAFGVLKTPDVEIVGVRLDAADEVSATLWHLLSPDERQRAERFRFAKHRSRYVMARANLRRLLAERLRIAPREIELVANDYGKPRLASVHGS